MYVTCFLLSRYAKQIVRNDVTTPASTFHLLSMGQLTNLDTFKSSSVWSDPAKIKSWRYPYISGKIKTLNQDKKLPIFQPNCNWICYL